MFTEGDWKFIQWTITHDDGITKVFPALIEVTIGGASLTLLKPVVDDVAISLNPDKSSFDIGANSIEFLTVPYQCQADAVTST